MPRVPNLAAALAVACAAGGPGVVLAADSPAAPAEYAPSFVPTKPNRVILLDAVQVGPRLLAAGERGVVLSSDDGGTTWKAQRTPTTRTLTGLAFNGEKNGMAVGHGATLLRSSDSGASWQQVKVADAGVDSLLGAAALGGTRVVAYGAFGLYLESNDNGQTWVRHQVVDKDFDRHISQVFRVGEKFLLVGESATLAISDDGVGWQALKSPYQGSLFGGLVTKGGAWLIYGMRGNVFRSEDGGGSWARIDVGTQQSVMNGRVLPDGRILLVGVSGLALASGDDGRTFARMQTGQRQSFSQVVALADGKLLLVGDGGVAKVDAKGVAGK